MAVSTIGVADAGTPDKYLHTHSRTISSTAREDQYVQQGESAYPTYSAVCSAVSIATADDHVFQLMGDGTNYTRIKRITITTGSDTPAAVDYFNATLLRVTTAGSGGGAITIRAFDGSDSAYGGNCQTLPSSKGSEGPQLLDVELGVGTTPTESLQNSRWTWEPAPGCKPIILGPSTASGVALKTYNAVASADVNVTIEFITTTYL